MRNKSTQLRDSAYPFLLPAQAYALWIPPSRFIYIYFALVANTELNLLLAAEIGHTESRAGRPKPDLKSLLETRMK